jgi:carboxyl-terminal processing protease
MTRLSRLLRASAAASWIFAAGTPLAATPAVTDEMLAPLASAYTRAVEPGEIAARYRELFATVLRRVDRGFAREVDLPALIAAARKTLDPLAPGVGKPSKVFSDAINAALASLDPHSSYLDQEAANAQRSSMQGRFGGVGLQVGMEDGGLLRIVAPIPDTPAARADLRSGDIIIRLDGEPVQGLTLTEAVSRLRGEPGTAAELTVRRGGQPDLITVSLVREVIRTEPVRWSMEGDVLVLSLASFTGTTYASLERALVAATARGDPRAIVLDLRGNPGGLLREAVLTADAFLAEGEIVSLRGRDAAARRVWRADAKAYFAGVPMVVLIDGRTASAGELVAAALQENGRAVVMGQRSFGKGSVQTYISLGAGNGSLRLTTALYHGPSGRTVQRTGVGPNIELAPARSAGDRRREADRARALPGVDEPMPPQARVEESRCSQARKDLNPGLACALALIQAGGADAFAVAFESAEIH